MKDIVLVNQVNALKQQVKWLMTQIGGGGGGGIPVKALGFFDGQAFDSDQDQQPGTTGEPSDILVVEVYDKGITHAPTKTVLLRLIKNYKQDPLPFYIEEDQFLFATQAKNEVDSASGSKIDYYALNYSSINQTYPCFVLEKQGTNGYIYTVRIYKNGLNVDGLPTPESEDVYCQQVSILPSETIPEGTWAMVTKMNNGQYYMQVPIWL